MISIAWSLITIFPTDDSHSLVEIVSWIAGIAAALVALITLPLIVLGGWYQLKQVRQQLSDLKKEPHVTIGFRPAGVSVDRKVVLERSYQTVASWPKPRGLSEPVEISVSFASDGQRTATKINGNLTLDAGLVPVDIKHATTTDPLVAVHYEQDPTTKEWRRYLDIPELHPGVNFRDSFSVRAYQRKRHFEILASAAYVDMAAASVVLEVTLESKVTEDVTGR